MTLGEKLKKIRSEYRISLSEVAKHTKIRIKYLEYLENGEYEKLPAEVYVRGFVRSYASFLGAEESLLVKLYEREYHIQKNLKKGQFKEQKEIFFEFPRVVVTPRIIFSVCAILLAVSGFTYLYREFRSFAAEPRLVVAEPLDGQTITGDTVSVNGVTDKDARLSVNGQSVLVLDDGTFSESVRVQPGLNTFVIVAANKFKKEKSVKISVQTEFKSETAQNSDSNTAASIDPSLVRTGFEVSVRDRPLLVKVEIDGSVAYNGLLEPGIVQKFLAEKSFRIGSEDGSITFVRKEGDEQQSISTQAEAVTDREIPL